MAEALLRHRLSSVGIDARVSSAGLLRPGQPASAHGVDLLRARGLDMTAHRSQAMTRELLSSVDLVLAMAREHVREAVGEVAPDLRSRRIVLGRKADDVAPRDERPPLLGPDGAASRGPHVQPRGGEVHPQVFGLAGVVDRPGAGRRVRLEQIDVQLDPAAAVVRHV